MTTKNVQRINTDTVKEAILELIRENNQEFKEFIMNCVAEQKYPSAKKPKAKSAVEMPITSFFSERDFSNDIPF